MAIPVEGHLLGAFSKKLPKTLFTSPGISWFSSGNPGIGARRKEGDLDDYEEAEEGDGDYQGGQDEVYLVSSETLSTFEGEVRTLRTMQAEALAGYHEVSGSSSTE